MNSGVSNEANWSNNFYSFGIYVFGPGGNSAVPDNHSESPKVTLDLHMVGAIASLGGDAVNDVPRPSQPLPEPAKAALMERFPAVTYSRDRGPLPVQDSMPVRRTRNTSPVAVLDRIFCPLHASRNYATARSFIYRIRAATCVGRWRCSSLRDARNSAGMNPTPPAPVSPASAPVERRKGIGSFAVLISALVFTADRRSG